MSKLETRTYDIDGRGNWVTEEGYWVQNTTQDRDGVREIEGTHWEKAPSKTPEKQSLGKEYETNGPSGAPKVLALVHSTSTSNISLSFYILQKTYESSQQSYVSQRDAVTDGPPSYSSAIRWIYVDLFEYIYIGALKEDIPGRFSKSGLAATQDTNIFKVETFFYSSFRIKEKQLGPAFAIIAFDKEEDIMIDELIAKYGKLNRDANDAVVPVKLLNPRCIYVYDKKKKSEIPLYPTLQEEKESSTRVAKKRSELMPEYTRLREENQLLLDTNNNKLQLEIDKIAAEGKNMMDKISKKRFFRDSTLEKWQKSPKNLLNESLMKEYKEKQIENQKKIKDNTAKIQAMIDELNALILAEKGNPPTIYVTRNMGHTGKIPIFFIDPDFSPSSLVRLVYDAAKSTGGRKHKSRKSKKSIKIKKGYIRSRKYTNKYRRRSYRH
jgi:hypothetical protein